MRTLSLAAAMAGSLLLLAPAASAQQQDQGWRGTLDQLNRTVNPDTQTRDDQRAREIDRNRDGRYDERTERERRMEGTSGSSSGRSDRSSAEMRRYSDADLRDRWERLSDEQRQIQRERRTLEDEMERRGIRR